MDKSASLWLEQVRRRQELMDRVMEKCGVDALKAVRAQNGDGYFEARAKCRACVHEDNCRNWCLTASELLPPSLCPNANFFRACRQPPLNEHAILNSSTLVKRWEQAPNASFEQRASSELLKLIWKLRWLGEDDDANKARTQLNRILARLQVLSGVPCAPLTSGMLNDTD
jgi:hypothetical protein